MELALTGIAKTFGRIKVLSDLDHRFPPASITAILGENGAGKSTLLRVLAGVLSPDTGRVLCDGKPFHREDLSLRRRMAYTPEVPLIFPEWSVARNLSIYAGLYGIDIAAREETAVRWLSDTGTLGLMRRNVGSLSRGQAWKIGLAAVALVEPEVWLVDEPFASGMDAIGLGCFRRLASQLASQGSTVIYTTQLVELAAGFSDWIGVLRGGTLAHWESTKALRANMKRGTEEVELLLKGLRQETPS